MEFLSHLPSTSPSSNPLRPTLFELIAQDQLRDLIQPALRYIVAFYAQRHPQYLLRLATWYDEFYAGLMFLVDRHFLVTSGGSFTENFYGLKRERLIACPPLTRVTAKVPQQVSQRTKLRSIDIYKSLFMLIGVPYLKSKLDDLYEIHSGGAIRYFSNTQLPSQPPANATRRHKLIFYLKRYFRILYPYINAGWYITILGWHLRYLFGKTDCYNPLFRIMGLKLTRLTPSDNTPPPPPPGDIAGNTSLSRSPITLLRTRILLLLSSSLSLVLPTSIFLLKFLEWWSSSTFPRHLKQSTTQNIEIPPPELPPSATLNLVEEETCPLCDKTIVNPTAVLESGRVFCYRCVFAYIESYGRCPVTHIRTLSGTEGLRRIRI